MKRSDSHKLSSDLHVACIHIHHTEMHTLVHTCVHIHPTSCLLIYTLHAHTYTGVHTLPQVVSDLHLWMHIHTQIHACAHINAKKRKRNLFTMLSIFTSFFLIPDGVVGDRVRFSKAERKIQHAGMLSLLYEWTVWPSAFNEHLYCFQFFAVTGGLCDHSHVWLLMFLLYSSFSCMSRNGTAGFSCMLPLTGNVQPVWGSCIHSQSWQ